MTRSILTVIAMGAMASVVGAPLFATGCKATGVGDPCTPEQEYNQAFSGFDILEVNVESKSFQCQTRICLANHFQGRVSCPYGQDADGKASNGAKPCAVPGSTADKLPITGPVGADGKTPLDPKAGKTVKPQCTNRTTDKAVYCSCRCADINGDTSDGASYCKCPDGFACTQLVTSIGQGDTGLTGAYCIKEKTDYATHQACDGTCDPDPSVKINKCN